MENSAPAKTTSVNVLIEDWASDKDAFKNVSWGKAMMWIFLLSDTFIFSCFLVGYMSVRMTTADPWPNSSEVFALTIMGEHIPLILIAIMTSLRELRGYSIEKHTYLFLDTMKKIREFF